MNIKQIEIQKLNKKLNNYDYGIVIDGKPITSDSKDYNTDKSKTLSIEEFSKYKIGSCWDYTNYEAWYFSSKLNMNLTQSDLILDNTFSVYYMDHRIRGTDETPTHMARI